jgi:hypothetical protein
LASKLRAVFIAHGGATSNVWLGLRLDAADTLTRSAERSRSMEGDEDFLVSRAAIALLLLGALLGIVGAYMIWGTGGVLLFVGTALLAFGLTGK